MDCKDSTENSSGSGLATSLYLLNKPKFVPGNRMLVDIHRAYLAHWMSLGRKLNYSRSISELKMDSTIPIFAVEPGMVKVSETVNCTPKCCQSAVRSCSQYSVLPCSSSSHHSLDTLTAWFPSCRSA